MDTIKSYKILKSKKNFIKVQDFKTKDIFWIELTEEPPKNQQEMSETEIYMYKFGRRLQMLMHEHDYSRTKLQHTLGLQGTDAIAKWLQGTCFPRLKHLLPMLKLFNTSFTYLLDGITIDEIKPK